MRQKVTFLWGYVKSKVFVSPPASVDDLKARITRVFDVLKENRNRAFVRRAARDMIKRINLCIDRNGGHVEGNVR